MKLRYYMYPPAYEGTTCNSIEHNLKELNKVLTKHSDMYDILCYDNTLFNVATEDNNTFADAIFSNLPDIQFRRVILPRIFTKLTVIENNLADKESMDTAFPDSRNALWGILFQEDKPYNLTNADKYLAFRYTTVREALNESNFRELRKLIFKNLVFTDDAISQITTVGDKIFNQIIDRLQELDRYSSKWLQGAFSIKDINGQTALNISDESDTVKNNEKLRRERYFTLPDIGGQYCYLHIKTGDLRFHFYPDNKSHTVYIAYIGPHLSL